MGGWFTDFILQPASPLRICISASKSMPTLISSNIFLSAISIKCNLMLSTFFVHVLVQIKCVAAPNNLIRNWIFWTWNLYIDYSFFFPFNIYLFFLYLNLVLVEPPHRVRKKDFNFLFTFNYRITIVLLFIYTH